jgi:hypothetical protein
MRNGLIINEYGDKYWYKNNLLHRADGPAITYHNGAEYWFFEGKLHRVNGPAVIESNGSQFWYYENKLHRTDGPAMICNGYKAWHLNGKQLTHEKWLIALGHMKGSL